MRHSYSRLSIEKRILKVIDESGFELTPKEIAKKIHVKRSSVRVILRKLLGRGLIVQPFSGVYCKKITYNMRYAPLCVHNLRLSSFVLDDVAHWEKTEKVGEVVVHVCFGAERRKISGYIACNKGMSHDTCFLALNRWIDLAENKLSCPLVDLQLTSLECNRDYYGVRIDGIQCVTKKDLFGTIDRIYQKDRDMVRKELRVSRPMSINAFEAAISRGFEGFSQSQEIFELREQTAKLTEGVKYNNSRLLGVEKTTDAIFNEIIKLHEKSMSGQWGAANVG